MKSKVINPAADLVFDMKTREMCKSCKRYGLKATCPPHIDSLEYYRELLPTYTLGVLYYKQFEIIGVDYTAMSRDSSIEMHKHVSAALESLRDEGHYFTLGLGAGSCKLCRQCTFPCPIPSRALVPIEAAGINVVATMARQDVKLTFPVETYFYRVAAVFYN